MNSSLTTDVGTPSYMAPEIKLNKRYTNKIDIFALGLILFEMMTRPMTSHEKFYDQNNLVNSQVIPRHVVSKFQDASQIVLKMTQSNPDDRPTIQQIFDSDHYKKWQKESQSADTQKK